MRWVFLEVEVLILLMKGFESYLRQLKTSLVRTEKILKISFFSYFNRKMCLIDLLGHKIQLVSVQFWIFVTNLACGKYYVFFTLKFIFWAWIKNFLHCLLFDFSSFKHFFGIENIPDTLRKCDEFEINILLSNLLTKPDLSWRHDKWWILTLKIL